MSKINAARTRAESSRTNLNKAFENALSILPAYMNIRWASIIDTRNMDPIYVYPEYTDVLDLMENIGSLGNLFKLQYGDLKEVDIFKINRKDGYCFICLTISNRHALIVKLPSSPSLHPAKKMCEHVKLILEQLLNTNNFEL
ncbi:MAG: hypothetical protein JSV20_08590 [Candidatus Bathyarchaeota archaeon]|nr:MAG: hypothetical protein JSV20_08590 [Candidatus Bathyarchaeota archaeon]